jgi:hypothetical protein
LEQPPGVALESGRGASNRELAVAFIRGYQVRAIDAAFHINVAP